MTLPRSWFLPRDESVLSLLNEQWHTVRTSIEMAAAWLVTLPVSAVVGALLLPCWEVLT